MNDDQLIVDGGAAGVCWRPDAMSSLETMPVPSYHRAARGLGPEVGGSSVDHTEQAP
jgi:hypothetical protein